MWKTIFKKNALTIGDLPEEVLVQILSHLPFNDRKLSRLVCKRWNELSYSYYLIKNDWLVVPSVPSLKKFENLSAHFRVSNLRILEVGHKYEKTDFWKILGPQIKGIELNVVSMNNPVLVDVLKNSPNLRYLAIFGGRCPDSTATSFVAAAPFFPLELECLKFHDSFYLTNDEFNALTENARNLTQIYFPYEYYRWERSVEFSTVLNLIRRQASRLTHLGISVGQDQSEIFEASLIDEFFTFGHHLTYLEINFDHAYTRDRFVQLISETSPDLEIHTCAEIQDRECLITEYRSHQTLHKVKISRPGDCHYPYLRDDTLSRVMAERIEFLSEMDLTDCYLSPSMLDWFSAQPWPNLKVLIFNRTLGVNNDMVRSISPRLPNLVHWCLDGNYFGDVGLKEIAKNNKLLQHLSLNGCVNITTVIPAINELTELETLNLGWCKKISISSLAGLRLNKLKNLGLSGLSVKNKLKAIVKSCPSLEHVCVGNSNNLKIIKPTIKINNERFQPDLNDTYKYPFWGEELMIL